MQLPRFRAWHTARKEMSFIRSFVYASAGSPGLIRLDNGRFCRPDEVILMIECPFPDRRGNVLHEDDLVRYNDRLYQLAFRPVMGWDSMDPVTKEYVDFFLDEDSEYLELAGNVHQDPELLVTAPATEATSVREGRHYGDKRRRVLESLPGILLPGHPLTASEVSRQVGFDVTVPYVYSLLKEHPSYRMSKLSRRGRSVTAFEPVPTGTP